MDRRRLVDAGVVLACLALTTLAVKTPWSPLPRPAIAVAGALASLAQWPRRRWPQVAALAGAAGFALSGNPGPALVGLYSGASFVPRRQIWLPGLAGWAGFVGWSWIDAGRLRFEDVAYAALAAGLVVGAGIYWATRAALVDALRAEAARADTERALREERARAAERTRIAREMHDVLAHKVSLIALYAGALELRAADDERLAEGTGLIRRTAREALQELREVLGVLRTGADDPVTDLDALVRASERAGQPVRLDDAVGTLPAATARVVYRVVQEGLTNVHKHAPGARTTVTIGRTGQGEVTVTVHNGPSSGGSGLPGAGAGLIGLAERIRLVGGTLRGGPDGRAGWELHAVVPWLAP